MRATLAQRFRVAAERGEIHARLPGVVLSDRYLGHILAALLAWYGNQTLVLPVMLGVVSELFFHGVKQ